MSSVPLIKQVTRESKGLLQLFFLLSPLIFFLSFHLSFHWRTFLLSLSVATGSPLIHLAPHIFYLS